MVGLVVMRDICLESVVASAYQEAGGSLGIGVSATDLLVDELDFGGRPGAVSDGLVFFEHLWQES